ncbi:GntR family transcriptional regulator [Micromonospora sp. KC606]|uniref:GntR family transcriptional regulator n=1 Tax=Micromonospora sp. KC606 TaxID=2530379 RepID=UPI00268D0ACF
MTIDPRSHTPVYVQLADILREQIETGELTPGSALFSEARMTQEYGVGREAVRMSPHSAPRAWSTRCAGTAALSVNCPRRRQVEVPPGTSVVARMPSGRKRRTMQLDEGVPVLGIRDARGDVEILAGDEVELTRPPN